MDKQQKKVKKAQTTATLAQVLLIDFINISFRKRKYNNSNKKRKKVKKKKKFQPQCKNQKSKQQK